MNCKGVIREISNYIDGELELALQALSIRLAACDARLIRVEAHESWLLVQVETLAAHLKEQEVQR